MAKRIFLLLCGATGLLLVLLIVRSGRETSAPTTLRAPIAGKLDKVRSHKQSEAFTMGEAQSWEVDSFPFQGASAETNAITFAEQERMRRMADNLLKPQLALSAEEAAQKRLDWVGRFQRESDPLLRQEIITEMVQLDDALTISTMRELLAAEKESSVRQQIILILGYMRATVPEIGPVSQAMMADYQQATDLEERQRILGVMSSLPLKESVKFMQTAFMAVDASAEDRFNAAEGLFKLAPRVAVEPGLIQKVTERLKQDAKLASSEEERLMAARALAAPGQDNKAFLGELLTTEMDPKVREFLLLASQKYPTR